MLACVTSGGKVLACGNGGSAGRRPAFLGGVRRPLRARAARTRRHRLDTDSSILTAIANDYDFERIFSKQVRALGQAGDVLLALSHQRQLGQRAGRHRSRARARNDRGGADRARGGGKMTQALRETDVHICVPHERTARIQEVHILALHCICDGVDAQLLGEQENPT